MRTVLSTVAVAECHERLVKTLYEKRPFTSICNGDLVLSDNFIYEGAKHYFRDYMVTEVPYATLEEHSIDFVVLGCQEATSYSRHISFELFGGVQLRFGDWFTLSEFVHRNRCNIRHVFAYGDHYIGAETEVGTAMYFRTAEEVNEPLIEVKDDWTRVLINAGYFTSARCLKGIADCDCVTHEILLTGLNCPHCGRSLSGELRLDIPGGFCVNEAGVMCHYECMPVCDECGEHFTDGVTVSVEGSDVRRRMCRECLTRGMIDGTVQHCDNCGRYVYGGTAWERFGAYKICPRCAEDVVVCKECGRPVVGDSTAEAVGVCRDCYAEHNAEVNSYASWEDNTSPRYLVDGKEVRYSDDLKVFGLELEVGGAYDANGVIRDNCRYACCKWVLDYEHDSSLYYGFETITQPMDKATFDKLDWEGILRNYSSRGYKSYSDNSFSCGLHIHFNRPAFFGDTKAKEEHSLAKLYVFFTEHWSDLVKASRRKSMEWCDLDADVKGYSGAELRTMADYCAKKKGLDHHTAINNGNRHTVEIRLGAGTLDPVEFRAWVDLMYNVVSNVRRISKTDVSKGHKWLRGISKDTAEWLRKIGAFTEELDTLGM